MRTAVWGWMLAAALVPATANAYLVDDAYVGGKDNGYGDVISAPDKVSWFNILGVDVSVTGSVMTVDIFTGFVDQVAAGKGPYPSLTKNGKGIGFGDLFLADVWAPYTGVGSTAANGYKKDDAVTGTLWQYGIALDDRWSSTGGSATLYALNGATNSSNALLSDDFMKSGVWRNKQEVAVKTSSSSVTAIDDASWVVDKALDKISFTFDLAGTSLVDAEKIAFHWAMTCANDTIEGEIDNPYEVPAPASLGLALLAGLGLLRRRR